jgi:signal transduction histidine kinase/ligand-binding sensor domain-containing protein
VPLLLCLAASHNVVAFDQDATISDFLHTGWAVADGAPSGVHVLAQTADGYLWMASTTGLFRFDGVRFERYQPPQGGDLQFRNVSALLPTPDGGLWIGRAGGATFLRSGQAHTYGRGEGLPVATIFRFALQGDGVLWAATSRGLFRFDNSRWETLGTEWEFSAESATDLFVDSRGALWVTAPGSLFHLSPSTRRFLRREAVGTWLIREAPDRTLWLSEYGVGIRAVNGSLAQVHDTSRPSQALRGGPHQVLVARDGSLWFTDSGIARLSSNGLVDRFTKKDGLTSDEVLTALEDREGSVWVATTAGLDRFRRRNIVPGPFPSGKESRALVTAQDGTLLVAESQSLLELRNGTVSVRASLQMPNAYRVTPAIRCAFRDSDGSIWLGGHGVLTRVIGNRAENIALPSQIPLRDYRDVQAITRDHKGDLWISVQQHGVFRLQHGVWRQFGQEEGAQVDRTPVTLWTDARGRVWLGYIGTKIVAFDGREATTYTTDGLHIGNVTFIGGTGDRLWAVGQLGFALYDGTKFRTIVGDADTAFRGITGIAVTKDGEFWLNQASGVARIPAAEVMSRAKDLNHKLQYELFDFRDGVPGSATTTEPVPSAVVTEDGRIWMNGANGTHWVDPARIYRNLVPPPVSIEAIYADDTRYDRSETFRLPVLPSNVRIEYTALSLSMPERVRFRYRLEGVDSDWQDAGTRRAAYYTRIPPGHFRFQVIASNNDGVWNETGAVATIVVPPAFFQTTWFLALCLCAAFGLLWVAYTLRLRQLSTQMYGRLEERVAERTRIARELHDTLLQSFQGLMLRIQVIDDLLPEGKAKDQLELILDRGDRAIAEGRKAVYDLRSQATSTNDLDQAINSLGEELAAQHSATFHLLVEGAARNLNPTIRDEVYRITREGLRNAFSHAHAHHIETEIAYGQRTFRVRVRDDGGGIQSETLHDGRPGHFGLPGMRERAGQLGGQLDIWSKPGVGTEVELTVAGSVAYGTSLRRPLFRWFRKKAG